MTRHLTIITGASRGLGHAMAQRLLQQPGAHLVCISRHSDEALAAVASAQGTQLAQWTFDLADARPAGERLAGWLKEVDGAGYDSATLVNNAGTLAPPRPLHQVDFADIAHALRVGLEAAMVLTAAFLGGTAAWQAQRKVLNISSGLGRHAMASQGPYCAAKAGMDHFSRVVALEQSGQPNGARIASLAPGVVDTAMQVALRAGDPSAFPDRARFVQLKEEGRLDSPEQAATKVLHYLARADFGAHPVADVRDT